VAADGNKMDGKQF